MSAALLVLGPIIGVVAMRWAFPVIAAAAAEEVRDGPWLAVLAMLAMVLTGPLVAATLFLTFGG